MIYEYFSYLCTRNECKMVFWYAKVLKYFQITSFFRLKLMQLEKNRYKKRNE